MISNIRFARLSFLVLAGCVATGLVSRKISHRLPTSDLIAPQLQKSPLQTPTSVRPFEVSRKDVSYQVEPVFDYELYGLVVSMHDSLSWHDMSHKEWNDYFNTADVCVIWGQNSINPNLPDFEFSSGDWTCYFHTNSSAAWQTFQKDKLSNNHLLPANEDVAESIRRLRIGDQIYFKGHLVNYQVNHGPARKSSITRDDVENGACEVVYITALETLARANDKWYQLTQICIWVGLTSLASLLFSLFVMPFVRDQV